jgi:hypothetical protein
MRRSIIKLIAGAALAASATTPAWASKSVVSTLPAVVSACDLSLPSPDALDCAGYFSGNLINGEAGDVQNQMDAIESLDGDFVWDGNWAGVEGTKQLTLGGPDGNQINFGETLFGLTIVGAHFGNVSGPAGNVSVFWLFDFGTEGADFITLDDPTGFSNAVLYTTGDPPGVPEPATWAMMLLGFGAAGTALRRSRRRNGMIAQIA